MTGAVRRSNGAGRAGADVQCHKASEHDKGNWLVQALHGLPQHCVPVTYSPEKTLIRGVRIEARCISAAHPPHSIGESAMQ